MAVGHLGLNRENEQGEKAAERHDSGGEGFDDALAEDRLAKVEIGHDRLLFEIVQLNAASAR
jgi:hypothetical protein